MSSVDHYSAGDEPFDLEREPLDPPAVFDTDWGGDGSDPYRPVRAHVLAALRPSSGPFQPPLDALLSLGPAKPEQLARLQAELGIGQEHVPELIRLIRDRDLNTRLEDDAALWGSVHALDLLAELDLAAYVAELIPLFDIDFDEVGDMLISLVGAVGAPAIAPLRAYLDDRSHWVWGRSRVANALQVAAEQHPELRDEVVAIMSGTLSGAEDDHDEVLTAAMAALVKFKAVEAVPLIRRAFELEKIDEYMMGPWGDVLAALGLEPDPDDPLVAASLMRYEGRQRAALESRRRAELAAQQQRAPAAQEQGGPQIAAKRKQEQARKAKQKRKASSASRKANRKKRK
jgi:hypothetical protein